jgi:Ca2+-binding RTX toxin-like protein
VPITLAAGAIKTIASGSFADAKFSPDGSKLYATSGGSLHIYNVATGALIDTILVAQGVGALDVSADGRYVAAVESSPDDDQMLWRVDLTTGEKDSFTYTASFGAFYDVAFLADGKIMVSRSAERNSIQLYAAGEGGSSGLVSAGSFLSSGPADYARATLTSSADRSEVFVQGRSATWTYTSGEGFTAYRRNPSDLGAGDQDQPWGVQATSPDGTLFIEGVSLNVYDQNLQLRGSLAAQFPDFGDEAGLVFSQSGTRLYVLSAKFDEIAIVETGSWQVVGRFGIGADVLHPRDPSAPDTGYFGDAVQASSDGRYLSIITAAGIQRIDLSSLLLTEGTSSADLMNGTAAADTLIGFAGDDRLSGADGDDGLYAGDGADRLAGGAGADILRGGAGDDILSAGVENGFDNNRDVDELTAGDGNDMIFAGYGDVVDGGSGFDTVGLSYVGATAGIEGDTQILQSGQALVAGAGTFRNVERFSDIALTSFNDKMVIGDQHDPATVRSWEGDDHLIGQEVSITMYGGNGNDLLVGSIVDDVIYGENGNDRILGYFGADQLWGGAGADVFFFAVDTAIDKINDFEKGSDRIDLTGVDANASLAGRQALKYVGSAEFSGAAGELRVYQSSNSDYYVAADVNGDRAADLLINLGAGQVGSADFIL